MKLKFWGVRGSIPTPGPNTMKFGGNTSCVTIELNYTNQYVPKKYIVLDGGSGIREFGIDIMKNVQFSNPYNKSIEFYMFFSHVHWDHIQGIPFFKPMFLSQNNILMHGEKKVRTCLEDTMKGQQQYPNFPISLEEIAISGAKMSFVDLVPGNVIHISDNVTVSCVKLSHPDGVFCYAINEYTNPNCIMTEGAKKIVYATDTEHRNILDPRILKIAKDADVLIYDSQYTPEEYAGANGATPKFDWGHSTYEMGVSTAINANVKKLILFHHDPEHTDSDIEKIENRAKEYLKEAYDTEDMQILAAYEGLEINL